MPRSRDKNTKDSKGGRQNVLNMMGYVSDENDDDDDMEAELAKILGGGQPQPKKKPPQKLLDWSVIDAQVESSMRDVDEDEDDEVTIDDENDFMSELNDIVGEDEPTLLKPNTSNSRNRSPSPQPQRAGDTIDVLKSRKEMYEKATANAQATGQTSKVRRLQRGIKTLDGLLRSAKAGKTISEDDIPPVVATGQSESAGSSSASTPQSTQAAEPRRATPPEASGLLVDVSTPPKPVAVGVPTPLVKVQPAPKENEKLTPAINTNTVNALQERKHEYRDAALKAKHDGDKESALKYFRILKQFDSVIAAANEGQAVDLSKMPPSLKQDIATGQKVSTPVAQNTSHSPQPPVQQAEQPQASTQPAVPTKPKTVLEALEQRMAKYQSTADEAAKEGNGGKSRRMGRIAKQYKDAIRSHKAGRPVNFDDLPVPPGFPPIPGVKDSAQDVSLMEKANVLLQEDVETERSVQSESHQRLAAPAVAPRKVSPQRSAGNLQSKTPSPQPPSHKSRAKGPSSAYEQQVAFLENRQAAFKRAALAAKKRGDRAAAVDFLRKMKGFDEMIEAAKSGLKVDITNVPQPPVEASSSRDRDEGYEIIESHEVPSHSRDGRKKKNTPQEDDALYSRLLESLQEQIKKARAYAQQMTHAGDVRGAERSDRLASSSQVDYDYVRSCRRHGDAPPHFYYEEQVFTMVRMKPDIGSDQMELVIIQCIDLRGGGKDNKVYVEWEMPFPHDNPINGRTDEGKDQSPKFTDAIFRVPFNRKLKSNQRAIKNKCIKLDVIQKGGFLRSDKSLGVALIKLNPLESHCEIHAVEELKEGRQIVGKVEAYVRLRTPLLESDSQTMKERWVFVEHVKRNHQSAPSRKSQSATAPKPSAGGNSSSKVNIASLEVLGLELKLVNARITDHKKRGSSPPSDLIGEARTIQEKINTTRKFLQDGGRHAHNEYVACLSRHYQHLTSEAQAYVKQGKRDKAKLALTKKKFVQDELERYNMKKS